jgi:glutathione synthase/RimK-type ligase-like ATP-grasp enzyme
MLLENIGIFVPPSNSASRPPPSQRPLSKAVYDLKTEGIQCVFGHRFEKSMDGTLMSGVTLEQGKWVQVEQAPILCVHDRFPSQIRREHFQEAMTVIDATTTPVGNPIDFTLLCRDKIKCQRWLESEGHSLPPIEVLPQNFDLRLQEWGAGFIKPQFGALGMGVSLVHPGATIPESLQGLVPNTREATLLQRAIHPPENYAGMSVRCLIQHQKGGGWIVRTPVLRSALKDPVVNVARGAVAQAATDLLPHHTVLAIKEKSREIGAIIERLPKARNIVECGIDFVIDPNFDPWTIEVNSRPRGRLEVLAQKDPERFMPEHLDALAQPIRYLYQNNFFG